MIIVDTNVISELTRQAPDPEVVFWLDSLAADGVATTAITAAELLDGLERLPAGRRKTELAAAQDRVVRLSAVATPRLRQSRRTEVSAYSARPGWSGSGIRPAQPITPSSATATNIASGSVIQSCCHCCSVTSRTATVAMSWNACAATAS